MYSLLSVIIPCYNESLVIGETYNRLSRILEKSNLNYELLFINDGSDDNTLPILSALAQKDKSVKILDFSRNFGHQAAVTAGLKYCKGDAAVIIDADLQDPPEVILDMLQSDRVFHSNKELAYILPMQSIHVYIYFFPSID